MSEHWVPDFTVDQQSAIAYRRVDACVVAGPGSGKTTVLVERYRSLVEDYGFEPRHILAITFTEKAAANMKAKLSDLFAHNAPLRRELEFAWVSTIHGFCARVLKENAIAAGVRPSLRGSGCARIGRTAVRLDARRARRTRLAAA